MPCNYFGIRLFEKMTVFFVNSFVNIKSFVYLHCETNFNDMEELYDLFGEPIVSGTPSGTKYTTKVKTPIYEPKNRQPHILELVDKEKTMRLIREIERSNLEASEKAFLIEAAHRHSVFNYSKIADYYAHASKEMQELMEKSALVIIDYDKSIEFGFTKLTEELQKEWIKNKQIQANEK